MPGAALAPHAKSARTGAPESVTEMGRPRRAQHRLVGVEAQRRRHRREQVRHGDGVRDDLRAVVVGLPVHDAAAHAAAREDGAPRLRLVVAPVVGVDARRAPELAHARDERAPEAARAASRSARSATNAGSSVPMSASVRSKLSLCVSQPSSTTSTNFTPASTSRRADEAAAPEVGVAVARARRVGLAGEIEGVELRRVHEAHRLRVDRAAPVDLGVAGLAGEALLDAVERRARRVEARAVDAGAAGARCRGSSPAFCTTNGPFCTPRKPAPTLGPPMLTKAGRSRVRVAQLRAHPGAERRVHDRRVGRVAGVHEVLRALRGCLPCSSCLRTTASLFACSASRGRCSQSCMPGARVSMALNGPPVERARLGIERVDVARPAVEPEDDARVRRARASRRRRAHRAAIGPTRGQHRGEAAGAGPQEGSSMQELPS